MITSDFYEVKAQQHRPLDREGMRLAAQELARQGLHDRDIAEALRLSVEAVRRLLSPVTP